MKNSFYPLATVMIVIILTGIFGFKNNAGQPGGILSMRTSELSTLIGDNSITIVYEDGKVEKTELKRMNTKDLSQNLILINEHLNKIKSRGYRLLSASDGSTEGRMVMTYTFEKD